MPPRLSTRHLTADLLSALEAKGYPLGPGKLMQVEVLLKALPDETTPAALRTLLVPLLASSPEEQRSCYALFDACLESLAPLEAAQAGSDAGFEHADTTGKPDPEVRWRRYLLTTLLLLSGLAGFIFDLQNISSWALIAAAGAAAAAAGWRLSSNRRARLIYLFAIPLLMAAGYGTKLMAGALMDKPKKPDITVPARRTDRFAVAQGARTTRPLRAPDNDAGLLEATDCGGGLGATTPMGNTYSLELSIGMLVFSAAGDAPPGGTDSLCVALVYADRRDTVWFIADILEAARVDTSLLSEQPLPYPHAPEELAVDPAKKARADFYSRYQWPMKALLFVLCAFAFQAYLRWDERRRAKFVAEIEQRDRPPYVWHIDTGEGGRPDFGEGMALLLNRLRRRETADIHRLDIKATVKASIRKAGRADFRYREQTRPPEYLLLIDRYDANDHQARLFDALYHELRLAETPSERYFYEGDPRICFNEAHPHGVGLAELLHRHRDARLLLIGEGQRLLSFSTGQLAPWTSLFTGWRRRAMLLTKPTQDWGRREQVLGGLFALTPASLQGLDVALEQFETLERRSPAETKLRVTDAIVEPFAFEGNLMSSLRRYYAEPLIQWIAACAVYPALHWDLTLFLGRTLPQQKEDPLVTYPNLRQLARLPWFMQGRIPENARIQLLEYLSEQGLETRVRRALDELLRNAPAPAPGSVAWDDYRMNVILNELLLKPDARKRRELEAEFERYLAAGKQPDFVAFKQLNRQPTRLDLIVPDSWKTHLFRHGTSRFGWRRYARLLPVLLLMGAGIALAPVETNICRGDVVDYRGMALCLDGPMARLRYLEYLTRDAIEVQDHELADSLSGVVGSLARANRPVVDTVPYYLNTAVVYYNTGVRAYNCAKGDTSGCLQLPADSLLSLACDNFRRAAARDASVMGRVQVAFNDAMRRVCTDTTVQRLPPEPAPDPAMAWAQARAVGTPAAVSAFLRAFPDSPEAAKARQWLDEHASQQERADWNEALRVGTPDAFAAYKRRYPTGVYAAEADARIAALKEQADFEAASEEHTVVAYRRYLEQYPGGAHVVESRRRIRELEEAGAWELAIKEGTAVAYRRYLEQYPEGKHAAEARSKIEPEPSPASYTDPVAGRLILVKGGTFDMGCTGEQSGCEDDEKPVRKVTLGDYYMGETEVTVEQFKRFVDASGYRTDAEQDGGSYIWTGSDWEQRSGVDWRCDAAGQRRALSEYDHPVIHVSWNDAKAYAEWMTSRGAGRYRLPTEAEWEYAARGGSLSRGFMYSGSNNLDEVAWYSKNSGGKTQPVRGRKPNELGLYDMTGNVWEWCSDRYGTYPSRAETNPSGPASGSYRVDRGGSWGNDPVHCRVAYRSSYTPGYRYSRLGFRLARTP